MLRVVAYLPLISKYFEVVLSVRVNILTENFPDFEQGETRLAIFGSTTIKSVEQNGLRVDIAAPNKKAPSMSMALDQYIKEANKRKR